MKDKHPSPSKLTTEELQLIQRLRENPELMERFRSILEISTNTESRLKRADEIETMLIEEMRRLGKVSMESWAGGVESTLGEQLEQKDPSAVVRKKNAEMVVRLRCRECRRAGLAYRTKTLFTFIAAGHWGQFARSIQALGTCVNRFWLRTLFPASGGARAGALRF
jgi:hypothetical protein